MYRINEYTLHRYRSIQNIHTHTGCTENVQHTGYTGRCIHKYRKLRYIIHVVQNTKYTWAKNSGYKGSNIIQLYTGSALLYYVPI